MPLNHVALTVSDRERSATFYGTHFGLTSRIHEDKHLLILGSEDGSELALFEGTPVAAKLPRTNHFGFRAENEQQVRAARERFHDAGVLETEWQDDSSSCASKSPTPTATESIKIGVAMAGSRPLVLASRSPRSSSVSRSCA